jgi:type I restriction enzyme S subunit
MRDSGIPWLGKIPAHWKTESIRSLFRLSSEKTEEPNATLLSLSQYDGIKLKKDAGKTGMFEAETTVGYNVVHKGQFVMNIMLAWNGSYAVSDYDGVISPAYCVFDFIRPCNKKYFDFLLRQQSYASAFKTQSKGLIDSRLRLYPQYFKTFPIIIPPKEEQDAIVDYINAKTAKIDGLIADLSAQIEKLKEYKQRLIADAVTGQISCKRDQSGGRSDFGECSRDCISNEIDVRK